MRQTIAGWRPPELSKATVTVELLKLAASFGRRTWAADLVFALIPVLLLVREGRVQAAAIWWALLAVALLARALYCHAIYRRLAAAPTRLPPAAQAQPALAAVEGSLWALLLVLLPVTSGQGAALQLAVTMVVLFGALLTYAGAGLPWAAFTAPLAVAQAMFIVTRELALPSETLLVWVLAIAGTVLAARMLRRSLASNVSMRARADIAARAQEQANAALNRSREQLRLALDAIDAGVADTNLITGERFFSPRYFQILGYADRDTFLQRYRFSEAIHPDDRERVRLARRRHVAHSAPLREECRMQRADGSYVWVILRGESVRGTDGAATRLVLSIVDNTEKRNAEQRQAESEYRYRALVEASPSLIWICDESGRLTFVSDRACRDLYGYDPREVIGRHVWDFNASDFTRRDFLRRFAPVLHGRALFDMEAMHRGKRGETLYVSVSALPTVDSYGRITSVTGVCTDITAVKQRERELNIALRNQQAIFDAAGEGIVFTRNGRIDNANGALARMLGVTRETLLGQQVAEILADRGDWETIEHGTRAAGIRGDAAIHEVMLQARDGRIVWCQLTSREAGDRSQRILVLTDITSLKRREEMAWHQANHDELTGLPNRRLLVEHARRLLSVALRQRRLAAVMVLDLDGFKDVNDLFGHQYGDALLRRIAQRLSGVLREYDVIARTGGDEFVVLLPEIEQPSTAVVVAEKLIAAASENVDVPGRSLRMHASVGIALFPADGQDFDALLAAADRAMYAAKAAGKNRHLFAGELSTRTS